MKQNVLIFLFTFVYNDKTRINKLFNSIVSQTANNFIYYLYDDCSDDSYSDLLNDLRIKLSEKNVSFYYERGEKQIGINKSTEHCLQIMKNEFKNCTHFMWINSDDWLENNAIERFTYYINKKQNYSLYMSNMKTIDEETNNININKRIFRRSKNYIVDSLYTEQIYNHFLVDVKTFLKINPNCIIFVDSKYNNFFNDIAVLFLIAAFNLKTYFINECLTNFLFRLNSSSSKYLESHRNKILFFIPQNKYISLINKNYTPLYNKLVRVSFTHIVCLKLNNIKKYKNAKIHFKNNLKIAKQFKFNKFYLFPSKSSRILYYFPRLFHILHKLKTNFIYFKR